VNPARPGAAFGYVDMGGWIGGQAEYVMVPYADFNLLPFPDRDHAMAKIADLALLSDIFPTGYHATELAGVHAGEQALDRRRDHALLLLAVQTGLRISELAALTCADITLSTGANVHTIGKGLSSYCTSWG